MSQNSIDFSTDMSGVQLLDDQLTPMKQNILTNNSGTSRPSYAVAHTCWTDSTSTPWIVKYFDGTDDIIIGYVNASTNQYTPAGLLLNNLAATTAPTVNEDSADGYAVGSVWIDTTNDKGYQCVDSSVGAAVWKPMTFAAASSIANSMLANMAARTVKVNATNSSAAPTDIALASKEFLIGNDAGTAIIQGSFGTGLSVSGGVVSVTASGGGIRSAYQGLSAAWATNTTLTVTFQQMLLQTSGGTSYVASGSGGLTLNSATSGAGGIDTGSVTNNTWYYIYVIYNGSSTALLMSTSATSPNLPSGYTYYSTPISAVKTNGSAQFIGFIQKGNRWAYQIGSNLSAMPLIASSSTGNVNTPTWTAEAISSFVPTALAGAISLQMKDWSNGANTAICAPNNSYGGNGSTTNPPPMLTDGAANADILMDMVLESTNIYYASNGSISLYCRGFILNI